MRKRSTAGAMRCYFLGATMTQSRATKKPSLLGLTIPGLQTDWPMPSLKLADGGGRKPSAVTLPGMLLSRVRSLTRLHYLATIPMQPYSSSAPEPSSTTEFPSSRRPFPDVHFPRAPDFGSLIYRLIFGLTPLAR